MTAPHSLGRETLRVALDLRHPYAYLALGPTAALAESLQVAVDWLPIAVPTLVPPSVPCDTDDRGIRHRRHRAHAIAREVEVYAAAQGLVLRDFYRSAPADAVNLGWLWLRERDREKLQPFLEEVFRRYWALELDASKLEGVVEVLERQLGEGEAFRTWAESSGARALESTASQLRALGLYQSPAYLLEGEVFYGRQHLPMLRWILEGRSGPGPI